jgi:GNAT superfamily N-acetyltransferase
VTPAGVELSDDPARLDLDVVHRFLCEQAYWARGVARSVVEASVRASWCVGAYEGGTQVGFARLAGDRATFAWLCDVFVLEGSRGRGIAGSLVEAAVARARADGVRRVVLATSDAHELYRRHGFGEPRAGLFMELPLAGPTA